MKTIKFILAVLTMIISANCNAQFIEKIIKKAEKKFEREAENRTQKKVDKTIDKVFDKAEEGIDKTVKGTPEQNKNQDQSQENSLPNEKEMDNKPQLSWAKYDFVPGTEIIFEDNQEGEKNGEFPSKWDLDKGTVENANFDGYNVIYFIKCNANGGGNIIPLIKNNSQDYLPEEFTVEFDAYFGEQSSSYLLFLSDTKNQIKLDKTMRADDKWLRFHKNSADYQKNVEANYYPGFSGAKYDKTAKWRHIAVSFNTRALKAYMDDARILNIPNLGYNPTGISLGYHNPSGTTVGYIKNVRVAKGAVPLYDKLLTDGKLVTTGIKFDVNKATIKTESIGTINYVVKMMQDHPELKFSVEGHTDSDGETVANQKLSEARAKSVVEAMVKAGISADRLSSKGFGESKPVSSNDSTEGKAQNRRVEFVKM